eukprot:GHVQ01043595.1.p1 GENE.GHVQ01043595.1~~GHVQ01043595.1.p1  ORF type:complete len:240 (-),score=13.59 GHVQ01043595.1:863-1537(-)
MAQCRFPSWISLYGSVLSIIIHYFCFVCRRRHSELDMFLSGGHPRCVIHCAQPFCLCAMEGLEQFSPLASLVCGPTVTLFKTSSGKLFSFGVSRSGQLGVGSALRRATWPTPVEIPGGSGIADIQVGPNSCVALTDHGDVFQWGVLLVWEPKESSCVKWCAYEPYRIDIDGGWAAACSAELGSEEELDAEHIHVERCRCGWWEGLVKTRDGEVFAWTFLEHRSD